MRYIRKSIRLGLRRLGVDISRYNSLSNPHHQLLMALEKMGIDLVFDVGANAGQFGSEMRSVGYRGELVSFEPLADAHSKLQAAAKQDSKWHVHPRCALGNFDGEIEFNVAGNSVSSSVLPMMESHESAAPGSVYVASERVPVFRLDSLVAGYNISGKRPFMKLDTQGFEWQVMDGAEKSLRNLYGILCELSLVPLYEGQHLWGETIDRLEAEGFTLWSIQRGFTDPRDGRTLQLDATFLRL